MPDLDELISRMDDALNRRDLDALMTLYADDAVVEFPGDRVSKGREAIKSFLQMQVSMQPDAQFTLLARAVSGNTVMSEYRHTTTITGSLPLPDGTTTPVPGAGKQLNHKVVTVKEVEGGLISSHRFYFDRMEVFAQAGVLPAQPGAGPGGGAQSS